MPAGLIIAIDHDPVAASGDVAERAERVIFHAASMGTWSYPVNPLGIVSGRPEGHKRLGFPGRNAYLCPMKAPQKAVVVRLSKDDGKIHLSSERVAIKGAGAFATWTRLTLCGKKPATPIAGLPTSQPEAGRCRKCYALVDAYGYPKALANAAR